MEWVALTDGAEWRVFNAHAPVLVEQKLFRAVRVEDVDAAFELLSLLGKDNMRENRIEELWRGFFVDRQVNAALAGMFSDAEPPNDVVNLVAKRVPQLGRADVRSSLMRARATFDFPSATSASTPGTVPVITAEGVHDLTTDSAASTATDRAEPGRRATSRPAKPRVSADERKLGVRELLVDRRF